MKTERLFVGDIMQCVEYCDEKTYRTKREEVRRITKIFQTVKENAILVKTKKGYYVNVEDINVSKISLPTLDNMINLLKGTEATYEGEFFVDEQTLEPYNKIYPETPEDIPLFKLKTLVKK